MIDYYYQLSANYLEKLPIPEEIKKQISIKEFAKQNPSYYMKYPAIFNEIFNINKEKVDLLCISGFLYYRSLISTDELYDEDLDKNSREYTYLPIIISACQEETIKILTQLYGWKDNFWKWWNMRKGEFLMAMQMEKKLNLNAIPFDINLYYDIAEKKAAMGKIAIDSLHLLNDKKDAQNYDKLIESHRYFSIGLQLCDDFQDFREDLDKNQTNWLINELKNMLTKAGKDMQRFPASTLSKLIYTKGIGSSALSLAIDFYNKALESLETINKNSDSFKKIIQERIVEAKNTIRQIDEYMAIINKKIELFSCQNDIYKRFSSPAFSNGEQSHLVGKIINNLIDSANTQFAELKHVMYLGNDEGFENEESVHVGDVFQRALLLDILCDINQEIEHYTLQTMTRDEMDYLISQELDRGVGGWSYFPSVKEIAPDADDLGQVLQCLVRMKKDQVIDNSVAPLLQVLFENNYHEDSGGFETWIVPKENRSNLEELQNHFNESKWGKGPDNEVMANLLYAISLAGFNEYDNHINRGVDYLLNAQDQNGHWKSRWYYGDYYGTYTCLRLFNHRNVENEQIDKAIDFVINSQNEDGGWNNDKNQSSILGTSFAILCLNQYPQDVRIENTINKGLSYLLNNSKTISAEPFIIPKGGQPYKSKTMTMAYVAKALLANISVSKLYD